jgi:hypothetical protein
LLLGRALERRGRGCVVAWMGDNLGYRCSCSRVILLCGRS